MSTLDADDQAGILERHFSGSITVHVLEILLEVRSAHAAAHDIEHGQNTRFGAVDNALLEVLEVAPAGTAGVNDGGDAYAEGKAVGINAVVAGIGITLTSPGIDVSMNVNEAGSDI